MPGPRSRIEPSRVMLRTVSSELNAPAKPSVLVIDDEPTIRAALRRYFKRRDWIFDEAEDGARGLEKLLAPGADYTAIISDLRMPGMSGMALHDELAERRPELLDRPRLLDRRCRLEGCRRVRAAHAVHHPREAVRAEQAGRDPGTYPRRCTASPLSDTNLPLLINASAPRAREVIEAVRKSGLSIDARELPAEELASTIEELAKDRR